MVREDDGSVVLLMLDQRELIDMALGDQRFAEEVVSTCTIEQMGNLLLPEAIDGGAARYASGPKYWAQLKSEFRKLICTSDPKYRSLRKELSGAASKSHATIVSGIAAVMAAQFGVATGVMVPFCALVLIGVLKVGKEAFCATVRLDIPVGERASGKSQEHLK